MLISSIFAPYSSVRFYISIKPGHMDKGKGRVESANATRKVATFEVTHEVSRKFPSVETSNGAL